MLGRRTKWNHVLQYPSMADEILFYGGPVKAQNNALRENQTLLLDLLLRDHGNIDRCRRT
jgi:hypothetical protein